MKRNIEINRQLCNERRIIDYLVGHVSDDEVDDGAGDAHSIRLPKNS